MTPSSWPKRCPIYYGWVNVVMAAISMTATFPGRTHGLGLITEPLIADLGIERELFARLNMIASVLGAAFCLPIGALIDRIGVRTVSSVVLLALGLSSLLVGYAQGTAPLLVGLILVRGLGQSALSVASLAIIGKWFRRRLGAAMGLLTVFLTFGFIGSILGMEAAIRAAGWRPAWNGMAVILLVSAGLLWLFVRSTPESCGIEPDAEPAPDPGTLAGGLRDFTLREAIRTPAFWILTLGTSMFNLVYSALMLFNESILEERGFDRTIAVQVLAGMTGIGLLTNLIAGALATRPRLGRLLGIGLGVLAGALAAFPYFTTVGHVQIYGLAMGLSGGIITVVHFAAWGHIFGRSELGRIQSATQVVSVLASAAGPELVAVGQARSGSYSFMFQMLAAIVGVLAVAGFFLRLPRRPAADVSPIPACPMCGANVLLSAATCSTCGERLEPAGVPQLAPVEE